MVLNQQQRGGIAALGLDYVMAQVTAGVVPPPDSLSAPPPARAS